jgi:WD40 repeat protein
MHESAPPNLDEQHPWPGLAAYDERAALFFSGRNEEIDELFRLIGLSHLVALYGKSGLGKSSLLQAGLFPKLRTAHFLPVLIRLDFSPDAKPPAEQAAEKFFEQLRDTRTEFAERQENETLWRYLHRQELEFWTPDNHPAVPVFVFDQFEELFSIGGRDPASQSAAMLELASLFEHLEPPELAAQAGREARAGLDTGARRYRSLISFREDFLPEFKQWSRDLPGLLSRELRLLPLSPQKARQAVEIPGRAVLEPGVAEAIVNFIGNISESEGGSAKTIEPVLLSLCCYRLNLKRPTENGIRKPIDLNLLRDFGEGILNDFYTEALTQMPDNVACFIEEHLIQGERYRGSYPRDAALAHDMLTSSQLKELTDTHRLLRIVQQADTARIELIHDRLVGVVCQARDKRQAETERRELEERKDREAARELAKAEREKAIAAQKLAEAQEARADIEERARKKAEAARRRLKRAAIGLGGLLVAAIVSALFATQQRQAAQSASRKATLLRLASEGTLMASGEGAGGVERGLLTALAAHRLSRSDLPDAGRAAFVALQREHRRFLKTAWLRDIGGPVTAIAVSPDGRRIVSGGLDATVRIWEADTGKALREFPGHITPVTSVAFSPDGRWIASGGLDYKVRLWETDTGELLRELEGHMQAITSVAFGPEGKWIVSASLDRTLCIWKTATGDPLGPPLSGHTESVTCVAVSPDGQWIASGGRDSRVRLREAATGQKLGELGMHTQWITSVAFSPDSQMVVSGGQDATVRLWDRHTGDLLNTLNGHEDAVTSIAFSSDGRQVISAGEDKTIRLWEADTGKALGKPLIGHSDMIVGAAFFPDRRRIVSASRDSTVRLWNIDPEAGIWERKGHEGMVHGVAFSPDGRSIVSGSKDTTVRLWNTATGEPLGAPLSGHTDWVYSVAFSPDGRSIVSSSKDTTVRLWNTATGETLRVFTGHTGTVYAAAFSPDGRTLLSGSEDNTLRLWDTVTGGLLRVFTGHTDGVTSVAFSPDGRRVVSGSWDKTLRLWESATGKLLRVFEGHTEAVYAVQFSPDNRQIVSAGEDDTVRLWDATTGHPVGKPLTGHYAPVGSVAFCHDGRWIVSGSNNRKLYFWDAVAVRGLGEPLAGHKEPIRSVAVSPDNRWIVSGDESGTIRLWPFVETWADSLCAKLSHNMSRRQWSEWVSRDIDYVRQCPGLPIRPDDPETNGP